MPQVTVNHTHTTVVARSGHGWMGQRGRRKLRRPVNEQLRQHVEEIRQQVYRTVCSATWADDCLYRGAQYVPDFRCHCAVCREKFPDRLYPREARQSDYSGDCQTEVEHDPEFAEELDRLRNDRERVGSVFIVRESEERGRALSRRPRAD
jgi:hypothetical protein